MAVRRFLLGESGQMTLELAVAFPVLIAVSVIGFNALQFFGDCAAFDRAVQDAVRVHAASPAAGQSDEQSCALVEGDMRQLLTERSNENVRVARYTTGFGFDEYVATLEFHPTLFGMGLRSSVFGVALPPLTHEARLVVDTYRPGVVS